MLDGQRPLLLREKASAIHTNHTCGIARSHFSSAIAAPKSMQLAAKWSPALWSSCAFETSGCQLVDKLGREVKAIGLLTTVFGWLTLPQVLYFDPATWAPSQAQT